LPRRKFIALCSALIASTFAASPCLAANSEPPPWEGCAAVPKIQYDSAKQKFLLVGRFGYYLRTGRFLRRRYWYCH
jgi:hypothetical protein